MKKANDAAQRYESCLVHLGKEVCLLLRFTLPMATSSGYIHISHDLHLNNNIKNNIIILLFQFFYDEGIKNV